MATSWPWNTRVRLGGGIGVLGVLGVELRASGSSASACLLDDADRVSESSVSPLAVGAVGLGNLLTSEGGWWSLGGGFAIKEYDSGGGTGCNGTVHEVFGGGVEQFDHRPRPFFILGVGVGRLQRDGRRFLL